mgnify:CR=1 FL=1
MREFSFAPADETREKAPRRRKRCDGVLFFSRLRPVLLSARSLTPRVSWRSNDSLFLFIPVYLPLARTFIIIK